MKHLGPIGLWINFCNTARQEKTCPLQLHVTALTLLEAFLINIQQADAQQLLHVWLFPSTSSEASEFLELIGHENFLKLRNAYMARSDTTSKS